MKRQLQKIAVIAIIILANAFANAFAQTATWALTAGTAQSVAITGTGISAAPQGLSVLSMNSGADYTGLVGPLGANSQRVRVSSGWPQTSAYAPNRYYEYAVTVTSGTFNSATVSLPMGVTSTNNMRVEFFYSTDNFATSTQLNTGGTIAVPTAAYINPAPTYTFNVPLVVGKTLSVRAFPWYTGTDNSTSRYTSMQNVQITLSTAVVPLKLSSFNASLTDNKAILSWNTSNEINMQGFEVEKATDGKTFSSIGTIAAKNAKVNADIAATTAITIASRLVK